MSGCAEVKTFPASPAAPKACEVARCCLAASAGSSVKPCPSLSSVAETHQTGQRDAECSSLTGPSLHWPDFLYKSSPLVISSTILVPSGQVLALLALHVQTSLSCLHFLYISRLSRITPTFHTSSDSPYFPLINRLPFAAAHQLSVKFLVTFGGFDRVGQFFGFDEVLVSLHIVWWGDVAGHWGRLPVDALWTVLLQVCVSRGCRHEDRDMRTL